MDFLNIVTVFFACLLVATVFMSGMFTVGRRIRRYDIVDVAWGLVFIVITLTALLIHNDTRLAHLIVTVLVVVWGLRLSSHIYRRLRSTSSEDKRYVEMRKKWRSRNENVAIFLRVYLVQAVLATIVCLPVIIINSSNINGLPAVVVIGLVVWLIGFFIESLADRQLRHFIADPKNKGQLMRRGVWRYSRHPNYFGELTLWWGVGIMALAVPYGWIGMIGPMLISFLIIFVSGIPPTEKAFAGRPGWAEYKRQTSVLIPWIVRNEKTV